MPDLWQSFCQQISIPFFFSSSVCSALPQGAPRQENTSNQKEVCGNLVFWCTNRNFTPYTTLTPAKFRPTDLSWLLLSASCWKKLHAFVSCCSRQATALSSVSVSQMAERKIIHSVSYSGTEICYILQSFGDNTKAFWERQKKNASKCSHNVLM